MLCLKEADQRRSFLFAVFYSLSYTPLTALVATEAMDSNTRAKGMAISGIVVNIMGFVSSMTGSTEPDA